MEPALASGPLPHLFAYTGLRWGELVEHLDHPYSRIAVTLAYTGMRWGELAAVRRKRAAFSAAPSTSPNLSPRLAANTIPAASRPIGIALSPFPRSSPRPWHSG